MGKSKGMDLAALSTGLKSDAGVPFVVRHPVTKEQVLGSDGNPWTFQLLGKDSKAYQKVMHEVLNESAEQAAAARSNGKKPDDEDKVAVRLLSSLIAGWSPIQLDGQPFSYSPENLRKLMTEAGYRWLRDDIDRFTGNRANYLGN